MEIDPQPMEMMPGHWTSPATGAAQFMLRSTKLKEPGSAAAKQAATLGRKLHQTLELLQAQGHQLPRGHSLVQTALTEARMLVSHLEWWSTSPFQ